jgi:phage virion morphogenesis protein
MAGATIKIKMSGKHPAELLGRMQRRLADLRPALAAIGELGVESVQRNFEEHRSPEGKSWKPLSPAYAAWKTQVKGRNADDILILNRVLMGSIHWQAGSKDVTVFGGSNIVYAAIHQFGGVTRPHTIRPLHGKYLSWKGAKHPVREVRHPGSRIPARPFMGLRKEDRPRIKDIILAHLGKG